MRTVESLRMILMGGLAGILLGLALTVVWYVGRNTTRLHSEMTDGVRTLSGDDSAEAAPAKLGEKAEALSKIIEIRLRAKEYDKALVLLKRANRFDRNERNQIYEDAADAVLKPAVAGGENGDSYLKDNGGKDAVLEKLQYLYKIERQIPDGPVKVKLLLRMRNVYDALGLGGAAPAGQPKDLPGPETLIEDATLITESLPTEANAWSPWGIGGITSMLCGAIGLVLTWMGQEFAKTVAQEFAKEYGSARFKSLVGGSRATPDIGPPHPVAVPAMTTGPAPPP